MLALAIAAAGAAACASPAAPRVPHLRATRFLAFGDSLTEGIVVSGPPVLTGLTAGLPVSYPFKLQELVEARYAADRPVVLNAGLAGERASRALPRLRTVMEEADAEVLLLLHGANDLNALGAAGIPATVTAIRHLVEEAQGRGLLVWIATQPPQCSGGTPPRGGAAAFLPAFNTALAAMAADEGARVVDLFANFDLSLQGPDCLHPLPQGYTRIAQIFFDEINRSLERRR